MAEWTERTRLADLDDYHVQADEPLGTESAIWIDISVVISPVMKVYVNGAWREVAGGGVAPSSVSGEFSQVLPAFTQAMTVESLALAVEAQLSQQLPMLTQVSNGGIQASGIAGVLGQELPALTQEIESVSTVPPTEGAIAQSLSPLSQLVAGGAVVEAELGQSLPALAQSMNMEFMELSSEEPIGAFFQTDQQVTHNFDEELGAFSQTDQQITHNFDEELEAFFQTDQYIDEVV